MLFSKAIEHHNTETQRRLHSLFTRAVKQGEVPALKLLDKMTVDGVKGEPREVPDYMIPDSAVEQLQEWVSTNATKPAGRARGYTAAQLQGMTEAEMLELIQQQNKPKTKRKPRAKKE